MTQINKNKAVPDSLVAAELCFFVQLARMATRKFIVSVSVS